MFFSVNSQMGVKYRISYLLSSLDDMVFYYKYKRLNTLLTFYRYIISTQASYTKQDKYATLLG
jgi:hypothetical protein